MQSMAIGIAKNSHGGVTQIPRRSHHATGYFTAVGYEYF
jgi:hypothetical protein